MTQRQHGDCLACGTELIAATPGTWRAKTVFTHAIWKDLLFYGGGAGLDGGNPRHEMAIGLFYLDGPMAGRQHQANPIVRRTQFGLDGPGQGITPLSIVEHEDELYMFCTSRPDPDLQPRIVVISASVAEPTRWDNYTVVIDPSFSGQANNHGAAALIDPEDRSQLLLYFAALTVPAEYRILLARVPLDRILDPSAYVLTKGYDDPVLKRDDGKTNYPFVRYDADLRLYELWYSGHSLADPAKRACYVTRSSRPDAFQPSGQMAIDASGDPDRNDCAYATGPAIHNNTIYYSGRREGNGVYRSIFANPRPQTSDQGSR